MQGSNWTPRQRLMWRIQFAGASVALAAAVFGCIVWLVGVQSKAEASAQHVALQEYAQAGDAGMRGWVEERRGEDEKLSRTRFDALSKRIDEQSDLLREIRNIVLREKGRK